MAGSFELEVRSQGGAYTVSIGEGTFTDLLDNGCDLVLADRFFEPLLGASAVPVVYVDAEEKHKTLAGGEALIIACFEAGARRGSHLLAVGGGVVQDLATLVASLYMRGLPWTYAPTTLMAMADSCIGGKSSINAGKVKNLVGNIYPPKSITVDPTFLRTLGEEELVGGLSEAVKICFCRDVSAFETYLDHYELFGKDRGHASALLHHVLDTKRWFVEIDEFDRKERRLLNFGHTFGHALESATSFAVNHGVGVALGMLCAVKMAETRSTKSSQALLLAEHCRSLLGRIHDLAPRLARLDPDVFEKAFRADKKHSGDQFRLILPAADGGVEEAAMPATDAAMASVQDALAGAIAEVSR